MYKNALIIVALVSIPVYADFGIMDTASETNAKQGASNIGITQIWDHPNQVSNGQFYVPVEYNRTNTEGNGTEHDLNYSGKSDIDYIPLSQLKGVNGINGTNGNDGATGINGVSGTNGLNGKDGLQGKVGEMGQKGDKGIQGAKGSPGRDANVETRVLLGAAVQVASERYYDVHMFADYDVTNGKVGFFGARVLFKPGQSYESRQLEKLRKEIRDTNMKLEAL